MKIYLFQSVKKPERIKKILKTGKFHFSDWKDLNDPMEGFFRYFSEYHKPEDISKIVSGKGLFKVACFSLNYTEPLMWSHYADGHKGICIEIDTSEECDENVSFEPIDYVPRIETLGRNDQKIDPKTLLSRKIENWGYEKEIRAFTKEPSKFLKVGEITKIILGVRADESMVRSCAEEVTLNDFIRNHSNEIEIVKTKMDFDKSEIKLVHS